MNGPAQTRVLILGLGASGQAAVRLARHLGITCAVADERCTDEQVSAWFGTDRPERLTDVASVRSGEFDLAVVSPGLPVEHPWLAHLRASGIPLVPEFEWGLRAMPGVRVIAVTGTNGKSSLVKWIADALTASGRPALPAGNYGVPPCAIAVQPEWPAFLVVEVSSFQLELADTFCPDLAVLLNFTPNHLDRHPNLDAYAAAKARLFRHMAGRGTAVMHRPSFPALQAHLPAGLSPVWFGDDEREGYGYTDGWVTRHGEPLVDLRGTWWGRSPLGVNAAAGVAVLDALGVAVPVMEEAARSFQPLPHRMELVAEHGGVAYVNDSKASTLAALAAAVASGPRKKHLIAGGILKERDVFFVKETLAKNCVVVYCIGQAAQKLVSAWHDVVPCVESGNLESAVRAASQRAQPGEMVLLSPGCSSFDQFASYAQRGEQFKSWVQACIRGQ
jgi:UDP-N-acetylmuramoylalanine--D-glutamate ligase